MACHGAGRGCRPYLLPQHEPERRGIRGEGSVPRRGCCRHRVRNRDGRNQQYALCAAGTGSRVVSIRDTYGGTNRLFTEFLPRWGVDVVLCDTTDHDAIEAEVGRGCDVLYLETPTNPTLKVVDIARLAAAGRAVGATVVVDNTFATPINQRPLNLGAHLVLHSATKFMGGHSDAMGGVVAGDRELVRRDIPVQGNQWRESRRQLGVPAGARPANAGAAGGAAECERAGGSGVPGFTPRGGRRFLPGSP
jgi:hypothetical protein